MSLTEPQQHEATSSWTENHLNTEYEVERVVGKRTQKQNTECGGKDMILVSESEWDASDGRKRSRPSSLFTCTAPSSPAEA